MKIKYTREELAKGFPQVKREETPDVKRITISFNTGAFQIIPIEDAARLIKALENVMTEEELQLLRLGGT